MNIEEIKKEIIEFYKKYLGSNSNYSDGLKRGLDKVLSILDKYDNQPDYKSAFEQIKREYSVYDILKLRIEQIEQKYNLGGE